MKPERLLELRGLSEMGLEGSVAGEELREAVAEIDRLNIENGINQRQREWNLETANRATANAEAAEAGERQFIAKWKVQKEATATMRETVFFLSTVIKTGKHWSKECDVRLAVARAIGVDLPKEAS
jgi:hypothetical protein